jgi:soluble lytic murein transglycosylase-like protein
VFDAMIRSASGRYGVDPHLVRAVIKVESDFNTQARSHKGAQGLMQLMPETAQLHRVNNAYDPEENIDGGVRHLRLLLDRYQGDLNLTLAAYNAGVKAVERHRGVPPFMETREYIRRVMTYLDGYRGSGTISIRQ